VGVSAKKKMQRKGKKGRKLERLAALESREEEKSNKIDHLGIPRIKKRKINSPKIGCQQRWGEKRKNKKTTAGEGKKR